MRPIKQIPHIAAQSWSAEMTCIIRIFRLKAIGELVMLVMRSSLAFIGFVMLNLSLEFYVVLWLLGRYFFD